MVRTVSCYRKLVIGEESLVAGIAVARQATPLTDNSCPITARSAHSQLRPVTSGKSDGVRSSHCLHPLAGGTRASAALRPQNRFQQRQQQPGLAAPALQLLDTLRRKFPPGLVARRRGMHPQRLQLRRAFRHHGRHLFA